MEVTAVPFVVAAAVAVASWAIAKEEIFREVREWCEKINKDRKLPWFLRKLSYIPTCEYCTSFWVTLLALLVLQYRVLWPDWRGYGLAQFFTWSLAVFYMTVFQTLRAHVRYEQETTKLVSGQTDVVKPQPTQAADQKHCTFDRIDNALAKIPSRQNILAQGAGLPPEHRQKLEKLLDSEHLGSEVATRLWLTSDSEDWGRSPLSVILNGDIDLVLAHIDNVQGPGPCYG